MQSVMVKVKLATIDQKRVPIANQPKGDSRNTTCGLCGGSYPHQGNCPAQGKQCLNCGKMNHFSKVCGSKANNRLKSTRQRLVVNLWPQLMRIVMAAKNAPLLLVHRNPKPQNRSFKSGLWTHPSMLWKILEQQWIFYQRHAWQVYPYISTKPWQGPSLFELLVITVNHKKLYTLRKALQALYWAGWHHRR